MMDIYNKVLLELNKNERLATRYNNLEKLYFSTEDDVLKNLICGYCDVLKDALYYVSKKMPSNVDFYMKKSMYYRVDLEAYCNQCISSRKPEWQILAERNGWRKVN